MGQVWSQGRGLHLFLLVYASATHPDGSRNEPRETRHTVTMPSDAQGAQTTSVNVALESAAGYSGSPLVILLISSIVNTSLVVNLTRGIHRAATA